MTFQEQRIRSQPSIPSTGLPAFLSHCNMTPNPPSILTTVGFAVALFTLCVLYRRLVSGLYSDIGRVKRVPGGHWLWGHELEIFRRPMDEFYRENDEKLGRAYTIKGALFHPDLLVLSDPGALSHIFTKHVYRYKKGDFLRPIIARLVGKSLPWAEGDEHKRQRQSISHVFSPTMVKGMEGDIRTATDKLISALQAHITTSSEKNILINLPDWTSRATLDIIGAVGFGHDFQSGASAEAQAVFSAWRKMVTMGLGLSGFIGPVVTRMLPFISSLPIPAIEEQAETKRIITRLALQILENRRLAGQEKGGKDLLSALIRANEKDHDLPLLLDHIVTFVIGGHETTVTVINFALHELAKNKDIQDRLRREVVDFVGKGSGDEPTYEEYQTKLPLLDAVCKEALRLYPSAPHTERVAAEDDVLPLRFPITSRTGEQIQSIRITKGQVINLSIQAINRSKATYGPSADEFEPDRWLDPSKMPAAETLTQGWGGLFTFIEGPRICIGHRMAIFELKIILSLLIKSFEFSNPPGNTILTRWATTLQPYVAGEEARGIQLPIEIKLVS